MKRISLIILWFGWLALTVPVTAIFIITIAARQLFVGANEIW